MIAAALLGVFVLAAFDRWHERRCVRKIRQHHRKVIGKDPTD
jgi:hypothetical protein